MERVAKCNAILETYNNLNPNETNALLIENIPVLSIFKRTAYRPYLGKKKRFQLPDRIKVRQMFKEKMKIKVDRIISSNDKVIDCPSSENICLAFKLPTPPSTQWPILSLCRRIEDTLELPPIECEEVVAKLKSLTRK